MLGVGVLRTRLGRRLLWVFLLAAFLPLAGFAGLSYWQVSVEVRRQAEAALHDAAKTAGMGLAARCAQLAGDLELLRTLAGAQRGGAAGGELEPLLAPLRQRCDAAWLDLGAATEPLLGSGPPPEPPRTAAATAHLATGRPLVVAGARGAVSVFQRVAAAGERPRLLALAVRPQWFWDADELRANGAEVLVYDGAAVLLFHTLPAPPADATLIAALGAQPASGTVAWRLCGVDHLARYWRAFLRPQYGIDLLLVQSRPAALALAAAHGFASVFWGTTVLTLCCVLGLAAAQLRRILDPVVELEAATRRIAAGDFAVRVGGTGEHGDEIGALGHAFDRMTTQLAESLRRREQIERELAASRDAALAAAHAKAAFVTNVSHELRTPMAEILGATEVLAEHAGDDPEARIEFTRIARTGAERLARLVDDVLDFGATAPWTMTRVGVLGTLRAAVAELPTAQRERLVLDLPEPECFALGAAPRLLDAWRRLLHNAVKFSPADTPIAVRAKVDADRLCLEFEDRGVGISRLDLPRVFEPFCQFGRDQLTDKAPGTGLGLAIVKRTVERHGGSVEVESELGSGSLFRVRLPLEAAVATAPQLCAAAT
ncbi:MAG: HAMP domain-containing histidine kinase [Planctomycetes bacterium]|nr:HAMP domain-containing histidine kinase [Planctomycetota bacterium]